MKGDSGTEAIALWLKAPAVLEDDQNSVPGTHTGQLITSCNLSSRGIQHDLLASVGAHANTHKQI